MGAIVVEYLGEEHVVLSGGQLTFGRTGDLMIDSNPYLHRSLGLFIEDPDHGWMVRNVGSSIAIEIADASSNSRTTIAPGSAGALSFEESILTFTAGPTTYQLQVELEIEQDRQEIAPLIEPTTGTQTITVSNMLLTPDQRRCLVGLAEPRLKDRRLSSDALPTNREVAARLGWTITKFNRKLDNVCGKFAKAGIQGLRGDSSSLATRRRERLVDHALNSGIITEADLDLIQ